MKNIIFFTMALFTFQIQLLFAAENVALNKVASQSTTYDGASVYDASIAVDGNNESSITHTQRNGENQPWWQVDLGANYTINKIRIYNSLSSSERLADFYVFISQKNISLISGDVETLANHPDVESQYVATAGSLLDIDMSVTGRYVRIQLKAEATYLHLREVEVFSDCSQCQDSVDVPVTDKTNVALNKIASQSTTYDGATVYDSSLAVDGTLDSGITHTQRDGEDQPWWQVDLGQTYDIAKIRIYNSLSSSERLSDAYLFISKTNFNYLPGDIEEIAKHPDVTAIYIANTGSVMDIDRSIQARYVRIQLKGEKTYLHLREVEVWSACMDCADNVPLIASGATNVALNKVASQSSTYDGASVYDAGKAVDGQYDSGITHTQRNGEDQPWWQVDLGSNQDIDKIRIYNSLSRSERLSDFYVLISKTNFNFIPGGVEDIARHLDVTPLFVANAGSVMDIDVAINARYVRIQLTGNATYLHLREVEVWIDAPTACIGAECENTLPPSETTESTCHATRLDLCQNQEACEAVSANWCNDTCQSAPCPESLCDTATLDLCTDQESCTAAGGNWCKNECIVSDCMVSLFNATSLLLKQDTSKSVPFTGGVPPYTVTRINRQLIEAEITDNTLLIHSLRESGEDVIEITDSDGDTSRIDVTVYDALTLSDDRFLLSVAESKGVSISGGISPYTVNSIQSNGTVDLQVLNDTITLVGASAGTLVLSVIDQAQQNALIHVTVTEGQIRVSPATLVTNTGATYEIKISGGSGKYFWSAPEGTITQIASQNFLYTCPEYMGAFKVDFTDTADATATLNVTVNSTLLTLTPTYIVLYPNDFVELKALGGTPPYRFTTEVGDIEQRSDKAIIEVDDLTGDYKVTVSDSAGQNASADLKVIPPLTLNPAIQYANPGETVFFAAIGGAGDYLFAVETGDLTNFHTDQLSYKCPATIGTYWIKVSDALSNVSSSMIIIGDVPQISPAYVHLNPSESFTLNLFGGFPPYTLTAETGGLVETGQGEYEYTASTTEGFFDITAIDAKGAVTRGQVEIGETPIYIAPKEIELNKGGVAVIDITGGKSPYRVSAEIGSLIKLSEGKFRYELPRFDDLEGRFFIKAEDANGNKASADIIVVDSFVAPLKQNDKFLTIVAAGSAAVIGTYQENGEYRGKVAYLGDNGLEITWRDGSLLGGGDYWALHATEGDRYYINYQDTTDPPGTQWIGADSDAALIGVAPNPEIYPLPSSPRLSLSVESLTVIFSWDLVEDATGFNFCFDFAIPDQPFDGEFLDCIDVGRLYGDLPLELWRGASFHIGVQAYNDYGVSNVSNIESFLIPVEAAGTDNDHDGYAVEEGDCNDNDPAIHPGAQEIALDGVDQDCQRGPFD